MIVAVLPRPAGALVAGRSREVRGGSGTTAEDQDQDHQAVRGERQQEHGDDEDEEVDDQVPLEQNQPGDVQEGDELQDLAPRRVGRRNRAAASALATPRPFNGSDETR